MRCAVAARFLTLRVLTDNTFLPLTRLSEQSPSQEANSGPLGKCEKSGPIFAKRVCAVRTLIPGTRVKIHTEDSVEVSLQVEGRLPRLCFGSVVRGR